MMIVKIIYLASGIIGISLLINGTVYDKTVSKLIGSFLFGVWMAFVTL